MLKQVAEAEQEWRQAREALKQAQERFNQASGDYVDPAALELKAAEDRVNIAVRNLKQVFEGR